MTAAPIITSWIAGGSVIDMIELSKAGVRRKERKKLVLWSWRIQSIFLTVSILIPILSAVMMEFGWKTLEQALQELQQLNGDVETLAYRGWNAMDRLETAKEELFAENELVRSILEYEYEYQTYESSYTPSTSSNNNASSNGDNNTKDEHGRKPFEQDDNDRDRNGNNNYNDNGNNNDNSHDNNNDNNNGNENSDRDRDLQLLVTMQTEQATTYPTQKMENKNENDNPFFFPWTLVATSSPTEINANGNAKNNDDDSFMVTTSNTNSHNNQNNATPNNNNSNNDNDNNNADDSFSNKDSIQPKRTTTMPSASQTDKSKMHENSDSKTSITNNIKNGRGKNKEKDTNTNINKEDKQLDSPWIDETLDTKSSTATTTATITTATSSSTRSGLLIDKWCPNSPRYIGAEELNFWVASINSLSENTQTINRIFNYLEVSFPSIEESSLSSSSSSSSSFQLSGESGTIMNHTDPTLPTTKIYGSSAFRLVTEATNNINEMIEWFFANDWLLKFLVLVLNVINGLLLANVYFLSKNNIVHAPTRLYVAYVLLPLFVFAAISIVVVAVATGVAVLINSDFCSGGTTGSGSPQGTLEDFIMTLQQQNLHNAAAGTKDSVPNGALDIAYDAVDYFWTGCLTENPLQFLDDFSNDVDDASAKLNQITALLPDTVSAAATVTASTVLQPEQNENIQTDTTSSSDSIPFAISTLERLNKACQRDMSFLPPAISDLESHVDRIRTNIHQLSDTISCGQISPILRRVSHGAICVETPYGLTILWGCSFGIGILCFVLLTVRAALYNSVKYKKQRPTKPRRIVEKEFEEYKQFMGQYYGENTTNKWKLDGISLPPTKLEFEFDIEMKRTFDTVSPTSGSFGNDSQDGGSEKGGIHNRGNDDDDNDDDPSYGSSYDSEISDDEKSIDSSEISAIGSLLSDTKSIAMHTIHSLRNVKSLLSSAVKKTFHPHIINSQHHNGSGLNHNDGFGDYKTSSQAVRSIFDSDEKGTIARRINFDDDDSHEDSITDDSLYLPTVASDSGSNLGKISLSHNLGLRGNGQMYKKKALLQDDDSFYDEEGLDEDEDERQANALFLASNRLKQVFTPSNLISALSPAAPRKALPFLARTLYNRDGRDGEYNNEELTALVRPKQLANLVPFRSREKYTIPQGKVSRNTKIQRKGIPLNNTPIRQSVEGKKDEKITKALKSSFPSTPLSSSSLNDHSYNHSSKYNKRNLARGKSAKSSASVQHDERGRQERR